VFLKAVRFGAFMVLMFLRPLVGALAFAANVCLATFLFCLFFMTDYRTALWAFLGIGLALTAFSWSYDMLVARLAPKGVLMITER
jgi:hypothetical protein